MSIPRNTSIGLTPLLLNPTSFAVLAIGAVGYGLFRALKDEDQEQETAISQPTKLRQENETLESPKEHSTATTTVESDSSFARPSAETLGSPTKQEIIRKAMSELGKRSAAARAKKAILSKNSSSLSGGSGHHLFEAPKILRAVWAENGSSLLPGVPPSHGHKAVIHNYTSGPRILNSYSVKPDNRCHVLVAAGPRILNSYSVIAHHLRNRHVAAGPRILNSYSRCRSGSYRSQLRLDLEFGTVILAAGGVALSILLRLDLEFGTVILNSPSSPTSARLRLDLEFGTVILALALRTTWRELRLDLEFGTVILLRVRGDMSGGLRLDLEFGTVILLGQLDRPRWLLRLDLEFGTVILIAASGDMILRLRLDLEFGTVILIDGNYKPEIRLRLDLEFGTVILLIAPNAPLPELRLDLEFGTVILPAPATSISVWLRLDLEFGTVILIRGKLRPMV